MGRAAGFSGLDRLFTGRLSQHFSTHQPLEPWVCNHNSPKILYYIYYEALWFGQNIDFLNYIYIKKGGGQGSLINIKHKYYGRKILVPSISHKKI